MGGTRSVNTSDKSDPDARAIPATASSPSATTGTAYGGSKDPDAESRQRITIEVKPPQADMKEIPRNIRLPVLALAVIRQN